jgi:hypothetical protein
MTFYPIVAKNDVYDGLNVTLAEGQLTADNGAEGNENKTFTMTANSLAVKVGTVESTATWADIVSKVNTTYPTFDSIMSAAAADNTVVLPTNKEITLLKDLVDANKTVISDASFVVQTGTGTGVNEVIVQRQTLSATGLTGDNSMTLTATTGDMTLTATTGNMNLTTTAGDITLSAGNDSILLKRNDILDLKPAVGQPARTKTYAHTGDYLVLTIGGTEYHLELLLPQPIPSA